MGLDAAGHITNLVSNNFDINPPADSPGILAHDPGYTTAWTFRGNVTSSSGLNGSASFGYDIAGNRLSTTVNGVTTTASLTTGTNYAAPSAITTNSLTTSLNWTGYLALSSETGPNGDSGSITYDGAAVNPKRETRS